MASRYWRKWAKRKGVSKDNIPYSNKSVGVVSDRKKLDNNFRQINRYKVKPEPFPRVMQTRVKFAHFAQLNMSTAGVSVATTFRLNSPYDPYYALGGTEARGWPILRSVYTNYLVTGAKLTVSFNNPLADGCRVGVLLRSNGLNTASGRSIEDLADTPMCYMSGINNSGSQKKTMSFFVRPWTLMGLSKLEYMANTSLYSSPTDNNPSADTCLCDVFLNNFSTPSTVHAVVRIVYYVQLFNRKPLNNTGS